MFDVDVYIEYVQVQSESALRNLATSYPYDSTEGCVKKSVSGNAATGFQRMIHRDDLLAYAVR